MPPGWRLESDLKALVGGVEARGLTDAPDAPALRLDGMALFGGIAVGATADEVAELADEGAEAAAEAAAAET